MDTFDYKAKLKQDRLERMKGYHLHATGKQPTKQTIKYWSTIDEDKFLRLYYAWQKLSGIDLFTKG